MPESILSLSACGRHSVNNYAYVCAYYVYKTMERQQAKKKENEEAWQCQRQHQWQQYHHSMYIAGAYQWQ